MTNSGYIFVDCSGLELNDSAEQTITGIYNRAKAALASKKPAYPRHHRERRWGYHHQSRCPH